MKIKQLKEDLRQAQLEQLRTIKKSWSGKFENYHEVEELVLEFDEIDIYAPSIKNPFEDIYGEELKKKQWEEYVLNGVCGKQMSTYYKKLGYKKYSVTTDDFLNEYIDRGRDYNLIERLDGIMDDYEEEEMVSVLKSRTTSNYLVGKERVSGLLYEIKIPAIQAIQDIVSWCLKNECVGYKQDW